MQEWSWTWTSPGCSVVKNPLAKAGERGFHPLEKEMAPYSSILAWEIPWTEEHNGLQPWGGCKRVVHKWETPLNTHWHKPRFSAFCNINSQYFNSGWFFTYIQFSRSVVSDSATPWIAALLKNPQTPIIWVSSNDFHIKNLDFHGCATHATPRHATPDPVPINLVPAWILFLQPGFKLHFVLSNLGTKGASLWNWI